MAQTPLVQLHHRPVGRVGKIAAPGIELLHGGEQLALRPAEPRFFRDGQAGFLDQLKPLLLRGAGHALQFAGAVKHDGKRALGHEARVELLQRAGGGVARIGEERFARGLALLVQLVEGAARIIDLASHLQHRRAVPDLERQLPDRPQVDRDIVALLPVAAGEALDEDAFLVTDAHRDAVDFRLHDEAELFPLQRALDAIDEGFQLGGRVGVVEALHRQRMRHRLEMGQRRAADALARRIGGLQLRVRLLEVEQFAVEPVVFLVGDERRGLLVIGAVVPANFADQFAMSFRWGGARLGHQLLKKPRPPFCRGIS